MALPEIKVRVSAETGGLDAGLTSATASLNRFSKTSQQVAQQMSGMTTNTNAAAGAVTNIGYQFQDIAMMIASGQSPFMLAMQQGTQLSGILNSMKNPIQGLASAFLTVINPVSLITIATIGLGAAAIQAFASVTSGSSKATKSLEEHGKWLKGILAGYDAAAAAAQKTLDVAVKLPQGVVASDLNKSLSEQAKAIDEHQKLVDELNGTLDDSLESIQQMRAIAAQLGGDGTEMAIPKQLIEGMRNLGITTNSTKQELEAATVAARELFNASDDPAIRDMADNVYQAARKLADLKAQAYASAQALAILNNQAAITNITKSTDAAAAAIDRLKSLAPDLRDEYAKAKDVLNEVLGVSPDAIMRTAAQDQYAKTIKALDDQKAMQEAAAARTNAPSGGGGADKAAILAEQIAQLQASLEGEIAVETAAYQKKMELLAQYYDGKDALIAERQQYEQLATQQHADKLEQIEAATRAKKMQEQQMMVGNLTSVLGSISQIIGSEGDKQIALQKGISTAIAAINIAQGITKAFELPFPMNWTQAAAVAASGAAQIAAINSASRGGGSKVTSPSATSGGVASAAMNRTLTVQGITPGQIFSGDSMRDFMERMLEMQRDGYQVVLA